jgi:hypothetical protein
VIDPAALTPETLGSVDDFSYVITDRDAEELVAPLDVIDAGETA